MGETCGVIHSEAKFISSCEPMKLDKLYTSKIQRWDRCKINVPIPQGRNQQERGDES